MQGELLKLQAGIDMTHVPYKGDTPALQDVLAGHADLMFAPVAAASQHVRSGNLRALAVTSAERLKGLPDVPTMAEVGVPDFVAEQWQALYAPAGTPRPIIDRLQAEVARIIREPELMERLEGLGVTPIGGRRSSWPKDSAKTQPAGLRSSAPPASSLNEKLGASSPK